MYRPELKALADLQRYRKRKASDTKLIDDEVKEAVTVTCRENFYQYLMSTTLHGLRYIGDQTLTALERYNSLQLIQFVFQKKNLGICIFFEFLRRCFFVVTFLLVLALSIYFISNVWMRWSAAPIIIGLNSMSTSIKDLPFPGNSKYNYPPAYGSTKKNVFFSFDCFQSCDYMQHESSKEECSEKNSIWKL